MPLRLGRYFWKLFLANAVVMAVVLAGSIWVIVSQLDRFREKELSSHLLSQASTLEVAVRDRFDSAHAEELKALAEQVGTMELEGIRVTFVLADGRVLGDSEANVSKMESHADRPEIRHALASGFGETVRWSHTIAKNMKYVAVRVGPADHPLGVVRVSMAVQSIAARAQPARRLAVLIALVSVLAAVLLALALALLWSRRIQRITEAAQSISSGDLSARVDAGGHDEVALLGRSLNEMREKLSAQLGTIDRHRRTLDSLLSQLREGVVVTDADGRIVLINDEAMALLQLSPDDTEESFIGWTIEQCIPQHKLQDLLRRRSDTPPPDRDDASHRHNGRFDDRLNANNQEVELQLTTDAGVRSVFARAFDIRLPGAADDDPSIDAARHVGRTLVLTDVTELTRVMQVKADLAANASHELRTPLSAIRAAVETLRAVDWPADAAAASRFVDVVDRHSGRMEAMIGDLLDLSRLESGTRRFDTTPISARKLLADVHTMFADVLIAKNLRLKTSILGEDVTVTTSPELLRMMLRNLIDNAIRFTDPQGEIEVSVRPDGSTIVFEVADTGCGIEAEHLQRVFERFYQVEQARTGADRGTGLGLSIVRHAATAMNARVDLESEPGRGTRVAIGIPQRA
ncbi:MAG: ATP-binding protein [Phycisphaerae bacterium]